MWIKVAEAAISEIEAFNALLNSSTVTDAVRLSFLKHPKTHSHLKALSRVYRVSMRCLASLRKSGANEARTLGSSLDAACERLSKRGVHLEREREAASFTYNEPLCGVCYTHIGPTAAVAHLESARGKSVDCHLLCANFHVNRVAPQIP